MMNIFLHELRSNLKSIVIWAFSLILLAVVFLGIYPAYADSGEEVKKLLAGFPPELLKALGFDLGLIFSPIGFYSIIFSYIVLCGSIQAMILGISLISKEFTRKTADFLLSKPASRVKIMTAKLLSGVVSLLATDMLVLGITWLLIKLLIAEPFSLSSYLMLSATLFYVEMMFFALGILVAVIVQRIKSVIGVSVGIVFGFFAAGMVSSVYNDDKIRLLAPFKYYDPLKIIGESTYESIFIIINVLFVAGSIIVSYVIYDKRDIHSV